MHQQFVRKLNDGTTGIIAIDIDAVMSYGQESNGHTEVWLGSGGLHFSLVISFARFDAIVKEHYRQTEEEIYGPEEDDDEDEYEEDESWRHN